MFETLIINGNNIVDFCKDIQVIDGMYFGASMRGDNPIIPGVDGEFFVDKPYATNTVELGIVLLGYTQREFNDQARGLRLICAPGQKLSMERRMSYTTGNESHFAYGEYVSGLNPTVQLNRFGRTTLTMKVLEGVWHAESLYCVDVDNETMVALGDAHTHRMTVTLPYNGTVTNTTTDHTLIMSVPSGVGTGPVTVDVEACTAMQGTTNVSNYLSWGATRYPMRLVPGSNVLSGSPVTICYKAAYQ